MTAARSRLMAMLIVIGVMAASPAVAQAPPPPRSPAPGLRADGSGMPPPSTDAMLVPMIIQSANLTADQEARVRVILAVRQATMRSLLDQLRQAEDDLADSLFATAGSTPDVQRGLARVSQLRELLLQESARAALEVRGVLTPEQLARAAYVKDRLRALQAEMRQLMQPARP
jgi:Spy/CpxP family protein refolding chaperone